MPKPSPSVSTDTDATTHMNQVSLQSRMPDPDILQQTVLDIMADTGHSNLLPPEYEEYTSDEGSAMDDIDTPPMSPSRRIIIEMAQRMQPEPQGFTAGELNPSGASGATPQHSATASLLKQSRASQSLTQHLSGWQMDAS